MPSSALKKKRMLKETSAFISLPPRYLEVLWPFRRSPVPLAGSPEEWLAVELLFPVFFFFNDGATTEIYTLSLHDALPISLPRPALRPFAGALHHHGELAGTDSSRVRSEEHTSELQSLRHLVCRLLLE